MDVAQSLNSSEDVSQALSMATHTKNQWSRHRGYPPETLVFGKPTKVPGSVMQDSESPSHELAVSERPEGQRFRDELALRERARKAFVEVDNCQVMRRAMLQRSRPHRGSYNHGDHVMMWKRRGEANGSWVGPMRVVVQEGHSVVWVTWGHKLYRVAPEHLRPLSAVEEHRMTQSSSPTDDKIQSIIPPHGGIQFHNYIPEAREISNPNIPAHPNQPLESPPVVMIPNTETGNPPNPEIPQSNASDQPDVEPVPNPESETVTSMPQNTIDPQMPVTVPIPESDDELFVDDETCFHVEENQCWQFEVNVSSHDIQQWRNEEKPQEMTFLVSAAKRQRSEVKLASLSDSDRQRFHEAKMKEVDSWISTETICKILRHQIPRENILRCRWILTWKDVDPEAATQHQGKHKPKARLVVLGFEDPMVDSIPRDSPTMSKLTRMLLLQYAASMKWDIQSFDVQTAFLRGREQNGRLLGMEPPEEMRQRLRLKQNEIVQLLKGAYGRVEAPYLWFKELKSSLEQLGFISSPFDPCLFTLSNPETGVTEGLIGIHVDDGLCCGSKIFQAKLAELESRFPFGSKKKHDFTFTGLHISQKSDWSIEIDQTQYVKDIAAISLTRERRAQADDAVSEAERQSLRAVIGSLQYAATNTRPDLCSRLSWLQSQINKAKVSTLIEANRTLHEAKQYSNVKIHIQNIPLENLRFVAFSDASFASEKCIDSHQGMVIMSADKCIGENRCSPVNPIAWHSRKIQRVAVSTLSAEAMALAGSVDMLSWIRLYWAWICDQKCDWRRADNTLLKLPPAFTALNPAEAELEPLPPKVHEMLSTLDSKSNSIITTDCKSLYDLISRTAPPSCSEFRTQLQAKLIKEHLQNGIVIRWVPSGAQVADSLAKVMDNTMLRAVLNQGHYSLHDEHEILKSRSDSRTRLKWLQSQNPTNCDTTSVQP